MTASEDALAISTAILLWVCLPALIRVVIIGLPLLQGHYFSRTELEPALLLMMLGYGALVLSGLIIFLGYFIDGGAER